MKWPPLSIPQKLLLFLRHLKYKYCEQISTKVHWSSNLWPYRHFWAKIRGQASEHDITLTANNHIFLDTILKRHWYLHQTKCNYLNEKQAHKTGPTIFVWYSPMYKNVLRYFNKSLPSLNSTNDTIRRHEKSWMYSYVSTH